MAAFAGLAPAAEPGAPTEFITRTELRCADTQLTIRSYCERAPAGQAQCFFQKLAFEDRRTAARRNVFLLYEDYRAGPSFATRAACVKTGGRSRVILSGTKPGDCRGGCGWATAYALDGRRVERRGKSGKFERQSAPGLEREKDAVGVAISTDAESDVADQ